MQPVTGMAYLLLVLITIAWCGLHSGMITLSMTRYLQKQTGQYYRFYRLFFNSIALLTLVPVLIYQQSIKTTPLFDWDGNWRIVQFGLIGMGIVFFLLGARKYDARQFFGISQLKQNRHSQSLSSDGKLDISGVHQLVRHPWYTGFIMVLWARPLDLSTIIINSVFTVYLVIGSYLEERKLVIEFGDDYREFQKNVSMLIPFRWLLKKMTLK